MRDSIFTSLLEELNSAETCSTRAILQRLQNEFKADGCIFWERSLRFDPQADEGALFCVDSTLPQRFRNRNLTASIRNDTTGRLAASPEKLTAIENDFTLGDRGGLGELATDSDLKFRRVCAAKVFENGLLSGAISLYRKEEGNNPFTIEEAERLGIVAQVLPVLYRAVTDRNVLELVETVRGRLFRSSTKQSTGGDRECLSQLCIDLAKRFHCHEVTIFLLQPHKSEKHFVPLASTWQEVLVRTRQLLGHESEGLTGWVLHHHESLRMLDLRHVLKDLDWLRRSDPKKQNLTWKDDAKVLDKARHIFDQKSVESLPPINFLAVPIMDGDEILGVLRCSLGDDPFFFSEREQEALALIASMVATWWQRRLDAYRVRQEREASDALLNTAGALLKRLSQGQSPTRAPQSKALVDGPTGVLFKRANYCRAVSLRWTADRHLVLASFRHRDNGVEKQVRDKLGTLHFDGGLGAACIAGNDKTSDFLSNCSVDEQELFPSCAYLVCYPIHFGGETYGVLDIAFASRDQYIQNKKQIDALSAIASQAGAALRFIQEKDHTLKTQEKELARQTRQIEEMREMQIRAYAGVAHQIKSPLHTASERCRLANEQIDEVFIHDKDLAIRQSHPLHHLQRHIERIWGQCRKGNRVAQSMELLAKIASGIDLKVNPKPVHPSLIRKILFETIKDHTLTLGRHEGKVGHYCRRDRRREIQQTGDPIDILENWPTGVCHPLADLGFLEQVADAVVGNAFKYADFETDIYVQPRISEGELVIEIWEKGLRMTEEDARRCSDLFWRSADAMTKDADGSGLGLFLTQRLLSEMSGRLGANPTDNSGVTVVQIFLKLN